MIIWNMSNLTYYWFDGNALHNLNTRDYSQVYDLIMDLDESEYYG